LKQGDLPKLRGGNKAFEKALKHLAISMDLMWVAPAGYEAWQLEDRGVDQVRNIGVIEDQLVDGVGLVKVQRDVGRVSRYPGWKSSGGGHNRPARLTKGICGRGSNQATGTHDQDF
jgi:hypothetical protein